MPHPEDHPERPFGRLDGSGAYPSGSHPTPRTPGPFEVMIRTCAVWGALAAAVVFLVFSVLPLLHPFSGAAGAFVATFGIMLGQRFGGRRIR